MITQMSFMTQAQLREAESSLETWSAKCLAGLDKMAESAGTGKACPKHS
jgi:hypothetical protein